MEFAQEFRMRADPSQDIVYGGIVYDVMWVLARALNETMTMVDKNEMAENKIMAMVANEMAEDKNMTMDENETMTMVEGGNSTLIDGTGCETASGSLVPLENFTYSNELMGCLMQWNLQRTNFSGISVRINYILNACM